MGDKDQSYFQLRAKFLVMASVGRLQRNAACNSFPAHENSESSIHGTTILFVLFCHGSVHVSSDYTSNYFVPVYGFLIA
jgi:hypothetical protein